MFQFKTTDSASKKIGQVVQSHIEARGVAWLLQLGFGECNDYAQSVAAIVQCRFETAARTIRTIKAFHRKNQPK